MNLSFTTPALLLGLLAAGIPVLLHLLASSRAPREYVPTLRFLQEAVTITSRRRQVQRWLLLGLRSLLMGLLALALAEPMTRWLATPQLGRRSAVAIVLDNSWSMGQRTEAGVVFDDARTDIQNLLSGDVQPSRAGLWVTNTNRPTPELLLAELDDVRDALEAATLSDDIAPLVPRARDAHRTLTASDNPQKFLCLFTDMQATSAEALMDLRANVADDVTLILVSPNKGTAPDDIGVSRLDISGHPVIHADVTIAATLLNTANQPALADAELFIGGAPTGQSARVRLPAAGATASLTRVEFTVPLAQTEALEGEIRIDTPDAFDANNGREFAIQPAEPIDVLIVAGDRGDAFTAPGAILELALDPFVGTDNDTIHTTLINAAAFTPDSLFGRRAVFFCNVPRFTPSQVEAMETFVRQGGLAAFLLGPDVDADNYNALLAANTNRLLPVTLGQTFDHATPDATTPSEWFNIEHPYLAGLYPSEDRYPTLLVRRYMRMTRTTVPSVTLIRLAGGDPLLVGRAYGQGRVLVAAVFDDPNASNIMVEPVVPAILLQAIFLTARQGEQAATHTVGDAITLWPAVPTGVLTDDLHITLFPPGAAASEAVMLPLEDSSTGPFARVPQTARAGTYRWELTGEPRPVGMLPISGVFVVNPSPLEADLTTVSDTVLEQLRENGFSTVLLASSLDDARAQLDERAAGDNWWDVLVVIVTAVLLIEAFVANRNLLSAEPENR